jgi:hypothetical protein
VSDDNFLSRWSRRKHQVRKGVAPVEEQSPKPVPVAAEPVAAPVPDAVQPPAEEAPIPPLESLTPESDFAPFMRPQIDRGLRSQALKTLFQDPRFNIMDGLDVYIDDYSKPDPLPEGWLEKMNQVARLGAYEPPKEEQEEAAPELAEASLEPPPAAAASEANEAAEPEKPAEPEPPRHEM